MKKSRIAALISSLFFASCNMNGCVYGPPPDDVLNDNKTEYSVSDSDSDSQNDLETSVSKKGVSSYEKN